MVTRFLKNSIPLKIQYHSYLDSDCSIQCTNLKIYSSQALSEQNIRPYGPKKKWVEIKNSMMPSNFNILVSHLLIHFKCHLSWIFINSKMLLKWDVLVGPCKLAVVGWTASLLSPMIYTEMVYLV